MHTKVSEKEPINHQGETHFIAELVPGATPPAENAPPGFRARNDEHAGREGARVAPFLMCLVPRQQHGPQARHAPIDARRRVPRLPSRNHNDPGLNRGRVPRVNLRSLRKGSRGLLVGRGRGHRGLWRRGDPVIYGCMLAHIGDEMLWTELLGSPPGQDAARLMAISRSFEALCMSFRP